MRTEQELQEVAEGCAVYIPASAVQHLENVGDGEPEFLCIVDPACRAEDEEVVA